MSVTEAQSGERMEGWKTKWKRRSDVSHVSTSNIPPKHSIPLKLPIQQLQLCKKKHGVFSVVSLSLGVTVAVFLSLPGDCHISLTVCIPPSMLPTESSEEGFPHTPTSRQPSPGSSGRGSVSSQPDSTHPADYLCLSQCKSGSAIRCVCLDGYERYICSHRAQLSINGWVTKHLLLGIKYYYHIFTA